MTDLLALVTEPSTYIHAHPFALFYLFPVLCAWHAYRVCSIATKRIY